MFTRYRGCRLLAKSCMMLTVSSEPSRSMLQALLACRFTDVMFCAGLCWALPEKGDNVFTRYRGCRRPGTNRLVGGGWPQMSFLGGSFSMLNCEVLHALSLQAVGQKRPCMTQAASLGSAATLHPHVALVSCRLLAGSKFHALLLDQQLLHDQPQGRSLNKGQ